ncbi:MAG: M14 family metallocarboxypeptidase [Oscillospiraceae bacterium]|nr:M14 family metallocarboxypeptidase [Oscillospiraceae bacterium]
MTQNFYAAPPTAAGTIQVIEELRKKYKRLKVFPIGRSVLGRQIPALCIGNPMGATLFVGATHGLEWITTLLLIRFCEILLKNLETGGKVSDIDVRKALNGRSLVIVPCLNPDGVEISLSGKPGAGRMGDSVENICKGDYLLWQANANGVDINHNFDAGWCVLQKMEIEAGVTGPSPTRYGGPHPNSEPETRAITTFCLTYQPRTLYSFHSQGEEIYYKYGEHTPTRSRLMAQILAASSGYVPSTPVELASHGGLKDWFIDKFHRPGFTIEVGLGKNPLPVEMFAKIYQEIEEMLIIATLL